MVKFSIKAARNISTAKIDSYAESTHSAHSPATMFSMKVALVAALVGAASAQNVNCGELAQSVGQPIIHCKLI